MANEPTAAIFTCNKCGRRSQADARMAAHILPWMRKLPIDATGRCRYCHGDRWQLSVIYVGNNVDAGASLLKSAMTASVAIEVTTNVNQRDFQDIPANVIAQINQQPAQRLARVAEFAREAARRELIERGAVVCSCCESLFIVTPGKLWMERGYCSKMCMVERNGIDEPLFHASAGEESAPPSVVSVLCAAGHRFDVSVSFRGLRRPCPMCGSKTEVP